jgi:hypothetical protein
MHKCVNHAEPVGRPIGRKFVGFLIARQPAVALAIQELEERLEGCPTDECREVASVVRDGLTSVTLVVHKLREGCGFLLRGEGLEIDRVFAYAFKKEPVPFVLLSALLTVA